MLSSVLSTESAHDSLSLSILLTLFLSKKELKSLKKCWEWVISPGKFPSNFSGPQSHRSYISAAAGRKGPCCRLYTCSRNFSHVPGSLPQTQTQQMWRPDKVTG